MNILWSACGWGWLRLHTCCALSYQCAQVKPAITKHTQGDLLHASPFACVLDFKLYNQLAANTTTLCPGLGGAQLKPPTCCVAPSRAS